MEGLTEGRIVHYVLVNGEHRAAIVVRVSQASRMALQTSLCSRMARTMHGLFLATSLSRGYFGQHRPTMTRLVQSIIPGIGLKKLNF